MKKGLNRFIAKMFVVIMLLAVALPVFGSAYEESGSVAVNSKGRANLQVLTLKYEPFPVNPGEYVDVWLKIGNEGDGDITDLTFELVPEFPFSLDESEKPTRYFGRIYGNSIMLVHYKVRVSENAVEGDTFLKYRYRYVESNHEWEEGLSKIRIQAREALLSIQSVMSDPEKIEPGQEADVTINLKNLGSSVIRDINVILDVTMTTIAKNPSTLVPTAVLVDSYYNAIPLVPMGSSTEKRISHLAAGDETELTYRVSAFPDAVSKSYKVPVSITYQDELGRNYSKTDFIGLTIGSTPDLSVFVSDDTIYSAKSSGDVSVKLVNKGVTDVKFLTVELKPSEYYEITSPGIVYIGDLDSDDYENADFKLYVKKLGKNSILELPLHIAYKDSNNKEYEKDINLELRSYSMKERGLASNGKGWVVILLIALMGGGWYAYKRWEKKKKKK